MAHKAGERILQMDAMGSMSLADLSRRARVRSSSLLYVALLSISERRGWRFEVIEFGTELYIRACSKHTIELMG
jgi:hypothetical protein